MRVLIAGADSDFAKAARHALRSESPAVETAGNAAEALEPAVAVPYSALVLDLTLSGARGVDLLKRMRRTFALEVIFISSE